MLGMFLNSFIGRKWGPRVLLLGGLGISIVINVVFGFANSYWTFLTFMFFNGLVQASGWPGCVGAVAEWLRKRERGTIMGVWSTNYLVGNIMVKSLGGYLLASYGWRYAFFGCTILAFVIWWLVYFWQRTRPEDVGLEPIVDEAEETHAVQATNEIRVTFRQYCKILVNPVVPVMGLSYFCLKFLRYALDSWLPTFLNLQGFDVGRAAYYSQIFDIAGFAGVLLAGWALDRWFHGRWDILCFVMGVGMVLGYVTVVKFGGNPYALAFCFGLVGFMLYGPDTLLCGAASVQVAGERNAVAVAGLVNGIGSFGPVIQEELIGYLIGGKEPQIGMRNANLLALSMSAAFVVMMLTVIWHVRAAYRKNVAHHENGD
jgi:OPA family sugar phosphate sensor protein UhpC-like MFS transporter